MTNLTSRSTLIHRPESEGHRFIYYNLSKVVYKDVADGPIPSYVTRTPVSCVITVFIALNV